MRPASHTIQVPVTPSSFRIEERLDEDGGVRLLLFGELDLAVAEPLTRRMRELVGGGWLWLDLARLEMMDCTWLDALIAEHLTPGVGRLVSEQAVRLDLAGLEFMDCAGLSALLSAVTDSERAGRMLEIGTQLSHQVRRLIELAGVARQLWPGDADN